ncbi:hypothetical protein VNO80_26286 [Phaseolus coccineus]|uniref:Uncharacterized protein n=1 Tax=Phaseolus coccineus TaxID=3886 RepID=A0AAN9LEQ3_PHACN
MGNASSSDGSQSRSTESSSVGVVIASNSANPFGYTHCQLLSTGSPRQTPTCASYIPARYVQYAVGIPSTVATTGAWRTASTTVRAPRTASTNVGGRKIAACSASTTFRARPTICPSLSIPYGKRLRQILRVPASNEPSYPDIRGSFQSIFGNDSPSD